MADMFEAYQKRRYLIPFRTLLLPQIFTDTLVIGSGVAGARAAIAAAESTGGDVIVLAKGDIDNAATAWAQGGIAAALDAKDSLQSHIADTLNAGAGLCDVAAVNVLVGEGPERIDELITWGMRIDREPGGGLSLGREGGHTQNRIVHADGDATGAALVECLWQRLRTLENVRVFAHCFALDLLTTGDDSGEPEVRGAVTHHPRYGLQIIWARAVILASGGAGQVYRETTNPPVSTGDGIAMAHRAGAAIADTAFTQFHPTTLYIAGASRSLITEAIRGEGAHLVDRAGRRFMVEHHDMAELAPRDVVSRAIVTELARSREQCVFLDVRHIGGESFARRFPGFDTLVRSFDLDPGKDLIPVHPSAHYTIGGVWTDIDGRTNLPGLFACGEAACSGVHGANRLASNSLLEGLVFGARCGHAAGRAENGAGRSIQIISDIRPSERGELDLTDVRSSLRSAMWRNVGIERTGAKLADALDMFGFWGRYCLDKIFDDPAGWETQNLLTIGALITRDALRREESRGVHRRLDHPETEKSFAHHALWLRSESEPTLRPVGSETEVVA